MQDKITQEKAEKLNIEESRDKRLGRIKAKRRDRGGIFQPREDNPLLDILMSRDVSGRSPPKPRSRSQRPSAERDARSSGPKARNSAASKGVSRRTSVASNVSSNVAGKQRRKSQASPSNAEYSDDESVARWKTKSSTIPKNSSRRTETNKGKSPALPSKRQRETDENDDADDVDLPSPPKRPKKSGVSKTSASTPKSRVTNSSRKPPSNSRTQARAKTTDSLAMSDDEEIPEEATLHSVEKKRGKQKATAESRSRKSLSDEVGNHSASTSKSKRTSATEKPTSSTRRKAAQNARTKKSSKHASSEEQIAAALNSGFDTSRRLRKKGIEPESEPESEEETHYRTKVPKPRLETVVEEDEEDEAPLDVDDESLPRRNIPREPPTPKPKKTKDSGEQKGKQKAAAETTDTGTRGKGKAKDKAQTKSTRNADNNKAVKQKPSSTVRRKPRDPAPSSKRSSKPTSSKAKPKAKQPFQDMRKSKFANLPTMLLSSPIKVTGNDDDEIDFLS